MINRIVSENIRRNSLQTLAKAFAISIEVTLILTLAGVQHGMGPHPDPVRLNIGISSYLLDATRYNRLWFHQFCKRNWTNLNGLLRQPVEQFAT